MSSGSVIDAVNLGVTPLYSGETFVTAYDNTTNTQHALVLNNQGIVRLKALSNITTSGKVRGVILFFDNDK